jgi:hypothetical protein
MFVVVDVEKTVNQGRPALYASQNAPPRSAIKRLSQKLKTAPPSLLEPVISTEDLQALLSSATSPEV